MSVLNLQAARYYVVRQDRAPYYASALYGLVPIAAPGLGTLAVTERGVLLYDPVKVEEWSVQELAAVLVHEVNHVLRNHCARTRSHGAEQKLANIAQDMEINDDLRGHWTLPDGCVYPETFGLEPGKSWEEYYWALLEKAVKVESIGDQNSGPGRGNCGSCCGNPGKDEPEDGGASQGGRSESDMDRIRRETAAAVQQHVEKVGRGNVPSSLARWADGMLQPPKVRWEDHLRRALRGSLATIGGAVDLTYIRPSRRQAGLGYGPGCAVMAAPIARVPKVLIGVDTSGSMGASELQRGLSEVDGILRALGASAEIVALDCAIHATKQVRTWQEAARQLVGGGGTDFHPLFQEVESRPPERRPDVIVFCTDGDGGCPAAPPPGIKVIWLLVGDHQRRPCDWGTFVEIREDHKHGRAA